MISQRENALKIVFKITLLLIYKKKEGHKSPSGRRLASKRLDSLISNINKRFETELKGEKECFPQNIIPHT